MGRLVEGRWTTEAWKTDNEGRFLRDQTLFRRWVRQDGSSGFPAVPGRYHLFVALACPWAHRTLIMRHLKGLAPAISITIVDPVMREDGWRFAEGGDPLTGAQYLRDVYVLAEPRYTGRVTVPVLWDKQQRTVVSNESREILRMLDVEFAAPVGDATIYCPPERQAEIDRTIDELYAPFNNGVYRAGFAESQAAYEEAVRDVFTFLDSCEQRLGRQRYLCGAELSEADICLYTTLVRFDPVYHYHFKCNLGRIADYPNLSNYLRDLYQRPAFRETTNFEHIKRHYYMSHDALNPRHIIPAGPPLRLDEPHDRARFAG